MTGGNGLKVGSRDAATSSVRRRRLPSGGLTFPRVSFRQPNQGRAGDSRCKKRPELLRGG